MANSCTSIFIHAIFSTHHREPLLTSAARNRLWAYMGGIARSNKIKAFSISGTLDHAHMLISIPAIIPVSKADQLIKGGSSQWLHENIATLRRFTWREGYGAFSIGVSQIHDVTEYIARQEEPHPIKSFPEERLAFVEQYKIEYDERYAWT
jgi:putative transposase